MKHQSLIEIKAQLHFLKRKGASLEELWEFISRNLDFLSELADEITPKSLHHYEKRKGEKTSAGFFGGFESCVMVNLHCTYPLEFLDYIFDLKQYVAMIKIKEELLDWHWVKEREEIIPEKEGVLKIIREYELLKT